MAVLYWGVLTGRFFATDAGTIGFMRAINPGPTVQRTFATERQCRDWMLEHVTDYGVAPSGVGYDFRCMRVN
jgi:hypothetical protein